MKKLVVVNNGHGQLQRFKRSPHLGFDHELKERIMAEDKQKVFCLPEWWTNREIVRHICAYDYPDGLNVVPLLPDSENYDQFLSGRVARANKMKPDLYVSVHSDAFGNGEFNTAGGHHVFYAYHKELAQMLNKHMEMMFPKENNRGIVRNPSPKSPTRFYELHGTTAPSVLSENFYFTNERECKLILDSIELIAQAHINFILEWINLQE